MENTLAMTWVLMLVVKAIWMFVIPAIITFAAMKLWDIVPSWIPVAFIATAVVGVVSSLPPLLIHMQILSVEEYGRIAIPIAVASGVARFSFAIACLGLALTMRKRLTEPQPAAGIL